MRWIWLLLIVHGLISGAELETEATGILQRRCVSCHGPKLQMAGLDLSTRAAAVKGGKQGSALRPGSPAESLLLGRIEKGQMPPAAPLPNAERETLRRWIEAGAPWGEVIREKRADEHWWSLQPLRAVPVPEASEAPEAWRRSPVDRFTWEKLRSSGLQPSPQADRRTLIRRLSFDLIGLPPDPAEVEAFENDTSPHAYENLVDRLLASPHYGERWGRHWLDVVRYSESEGFERDLLRDHVWRYRDYVIASLNADKPYTQFAREQLAGDVLTPVTREGMIATALLTMGPTDAVGLTSAVAAEREMIREDMLEEMLGVVSQTFLGLTVNCARCHDHKFDPIPQRDYYRMKSVFASVWPSLGRDESMVDTQPSFVPLLTPKEKAAREAQVKPLRVRIEELESLVGQQYRMVRPVNAAGSAVPEPYARWTFDTDLRDDRERLNAVRVARATTAGGALAVGEKADTGVVTTAVLPEAIREKTIEAWIQIGVLPEKPVTVMEIRNQSGFRGASVDGIQFLGSKTGHWENFSIGRFRSEDTEGGRETAAPGERIQVAIVYSDDNRIQIYRNGKPYGRPYLPEQGSPAARLQTFHAADALVRFTVTPGLQLLEARLYDSALGAESIASAYLAGIRDYTPGELERRMTAQQRKQLAEWRSELAQQKRALAAIPKGEPGWVASIRPATPTHLLVRGDVNRKGEVVTPGGISCVKGTSADLGLAEDAGDADKRKKLAEWITHDENPLFWRVIVNRIWHYHFGTGIVENPNDFGYNGGTPSHPELLDWLASDFKANGARLKALHRQIVLSETYRQSSRYSEQSAAKDADNRLLWRYPPRRLQSEVIRDSILAISGSLNRKMNGPSFRPFETGTGAGSYKAYQLVQKNDADSHRRTIYRMNVNTAGDPMLDALDCPLPSVKMPKRAATTTALQSLSLMNNAFVQSQAKAMATRLEAEAATPEGQLRRAFALSFGRAPRDWELEAGLELIAKHGLETLCWGILNTSELLYVE